MREASPPLPEFFKAAAKAFEPEWAMVPRFSTNSSRVMPMPVSEMVMVPAVSSELMVISSGASDWKTSFSVSCVRRIFSRESAALDTSSRMKISRSV